MPKVTNVLEVLNVLGRASNPPQPAVMPLRLTNVGDSVATVAFNDIDGGTTFETRKNGTGAYHNWDFSAISLQVGDYIEVMGDNSNKQRLGRFLMTGTIAASGSIMSLVYGEYNDENTNLVIPQKKNFSGIFQDCASLVSAPELPAKTLKDNCYEYAFKNCTGLAVAPALPSTSLANNCYVGMFDGCVSLTSMPNLPAVQLRSYCYSYMFARCTNLTSISGLQARVTYNNAMQHMFEGCTGLTSIDLPLVTITSYSCQYLFRNCSNLNDITVHFTQWGVYNNTNLWVQGVAATGIFKCPAALPQEFGDNRIPTGWTVETF